MATTEALLERARLTDEELSIATERVFEYDEGARFGADKQLAKAWETLVGDLGVCLRIWAGQPDVWERVENWLFNRTREIEDIQGTESP